ncbi:MAG: prepilin-type N-terminal cleavage/methylation domain-containing protein [Candidatus Gracilibacteria bacterium]|nr:prepilin-type N-terminal cleavage/methylation domain-containing protein [Candidatus Gracilibacteria bacterium]MDQ7022183.1 prepilin-type N-terminal cleavage/methylation domain-containing protein [Candidatus Gracilibacteria bacterium]
MNKKAFTLIELLIVITIITIISSTGVIYFFRQVSSLKISSEIEKVVDTIEKLDSEIDNKKILDYNIFINKNSFGFTGSINNIGLDYKQKLNMDFETGTGIINSNSGAILKIYSGIKFQETKLLNSSLIYNYNFSKNIESKILSSYSGSTLNEIFINYYSPDNIIENNENKLELININSESDKTGTGYISVEIKNLNGKKSITPDGGDVSKIYLFFEREGVEKFIEIKK